VSGGEAPEAERFFISECDCCIKTGGGGHHQWKILGGGAAEKGAAAALPLDLPLI